MSLIQLEVEEKDDYRNTKRYYHGIGCTSNLEGILREGRLKSKKKLRSEGFEYAKANLYEDIIRHIGEGITSTPLSSEEDVKRYLEENEDYFQENGHDDTRFILNNMDSLPLEGINFKDNGVWISQECQEARNYSCTKEVVGDKSGGWFELKLPEESLIQLGLNGIVPGEVPLEFAEKLHLEDVSQNEARDIWIDKQASEYQLDIERI